MASTYRKSGAQAKTRAGRSGPAEGVGVGGPGRGGGRAPSGPASPVLPFHHPAPAPIFALPGRLGATRVPAPLLHPPGPPPGRRPIPSPSPGSPLSPLASLDAPVPPFRLLRKEAATLWVRPGAEARVAGLLEGGKDLHQGAERRGPRPKGGRPPRPGPGSPGGRDGGRGKVGGPTLPPGRPPGPPHRRIATSGAGPFPAPSPNWRPARSASGGAYPLPWVWPRPCTGVGRCTGGTSSPGTSPVP
jgi:hypothetical protein